MSPEKQSRSRPPQRGRARPGPRARNTSQSPYRQAKRRRAPAWQLEAFGGRLWVVILLFALMAFLPFSPLGRVFDQPAAKRAGPTDWQPGKTAPVRVSVVTADYEALECASETSFVGKHCDYRSPTQRWPREPDEPLDDNKRDVIQPYRTWPDNHLVLLSGVWAHPEVAYRLHREPPAGIPKNKLARFVVECQVKFLGHFDQPALRWYPGAAWQTENRALVGHAETCRLVDEDSE